MTAIKNYRMSALVLLALIVVSAAIPARAQYSLLYSFGGTGGVDAANPIGAIAQGEDGSLYSTTFIGGATDWGAIFKITPTGKENLLYSFCSQTNCADGNTPVSGLTIRPDGHFLGTTVFNGVGIGNGAGTIFDISQTGGLTTFYTFSGTTDGAAPKTSPILGPDGSFYGVASSGGLTSGCGTIYRLTGTTFTVVHKFDGTHGCDPVGLVLGTDGSFYGTTQSGGTDTDGAAFQFTVRVGKAPVFTVLADFDSTTGPPVGTLVEGSDGNFYGVTGKVSKAFGSIFRITPSGVLTVLHMLNGATDGDYPSAGLTFATDGNFYGTTAGGGTHSSGTLFQITPAGSFSVLYNFGSFVGDGISGANIVQHTNGLLYGVTQAGGAHEGFSYNCQYNINGGCGVVYSWNAGLPAFVSTVQLMGSVGGTVEILGQGFTSATTVSFNGTPATATVQSGTSLRATVPVGATTGFITVTNSGGILTSNRQFVVTP